jgi:SSS family solute:Na+ symporter
MNTGTLFIFLFFVISIVIGVWSKKGKEMNLEQWSVGGRGMGTLFVFLLSAGEMYTTFTFLGASGSAYGEGGSIFSIVSYGCIASIISYWAFPEIWKYSKKHKLISQSDFMAKKYDSPILGVLVAIVGIVALFCYLVLQFKGLGYIVDITSNGVISSKMAILFGAIGVTIFVMLSGIHGSAWTSVLKDILILAIILFLGIYFPVHFYGGIKPMYEAIEQAKPNFTILPEHGMNLTWYISTITLSGIGMYMWPHSFPPIFAAKNAKVLRRNAIIMPLYQLILLFAFFVGFAAIIQIKGLQGSDGDKILLLLSKKTFDPWFVGLIGGTGVLAALVPASMILMVISTLFVKNIYQVLVPIRSESQIVKLIKFVVPFITLIGVYFTFKGGNSLFSIAIVAYNFITQLAPPFFLSLMKKKFVTKYGAISGIIIGGGIVSIFDLGEKTFAQTFPHLPQLIKDLNVGSIALVINTLVMISVSLISKNSMSSNKKIDIVVEQ